MSDHHPAPEKLNATGSRTYLELGFIAANTFILLTTFLVGIAANVFVVFAVCRQKSLQTSNNALVVNLAIIDFLRCVIDCPVLLRIVSPFDRSVESVICDVQVVSFSFSCCIQMLTLACISAERYQAISQPFKTTQKRKRIMVWISLTWIVAILVALICLVFLKDSPVYVKCQGVERKEMPQTTYDTYGLYMVLPLWAACFSIITAFYARIFALVRSHNRKIFDKGIIIKKKTELNIIQVEPMATHAAQKSPSDALMTPNLPRCVSQGSQNEKENTLEVIELEPPCKKAIEDGGKPLESDTAAEDARDGVKSSTLRQISNHPDNLSKGNPEEIVENDKSIAKNHLNVQAVAQETVLDVNMTLNEKVAANLASPVTNAGAEDVAQNIEGAVCMMPSKATRERANKKKESKMAKRAGYIIVTFLLFWLPIITTIVLNFGVHGNKYIQVAVMHDLEVLSVSVACVTSLSNPIIYAAVNPQFRSEFYRLRNKIQTMYKAQS
ncbi:unnamed protein product [Knipowitschia caucasica]